MLDAAGQARLALEGGIMCIQLREKDAPRREIYALAVELRRLTLEYGAALIINDHPDIALAVDADGVHLGQDDFPLAGAREIMGKKIIGISTHDFGEAAGAYRGGADYIGFGPVFETSTKDVGPAKGLDMLKEIKRSAGIPVMAIGGITAETASGVIRAGADAIAVSGAVLNGDLLENARMLVGAIRP